MGATVEHQGVNECEKWYQSKFLRLSVNFSKAFGGGEWLKANGLE
jgi:hypothetical protein